MAEKLLVTEPAPPSQWWQTAEVQAASRCDEGGLLFFCATTNRKAIRLCLGRDSVQYTFGRPGMTPELSFSVPRQNAIPRPWDGFGRNEVDALDLPNGDVTYSAFTQYHKGDHTSSAGVDVWIRGELRAGVECEVRSVVGHLIELSMILGPRWLSTSESRTTPDGPPSTSSPSVGEAGQLEQVDTPAFMVTELRPRYPPVLQQAGVGGEVEVEFMIDATGRVDPGSVRVLSSSNRLFEEPAQEAILRSAFRPALKQGQPVPQAMRQVIRFTQP